VKIFNFCGRRPIITPRLLPIGYAQVAENTKLGSGAMECFSALGASVHANTGTPTTIYKFGSTWFDWTTRRWIEKAAISGTHRLLIADGSTYPKIMTEAGLTRRWGVVKPTSALTMALAGTASDAIVASTVSYVYTLVTAYGEESDVFTASAAIDILTGQYIGLSGWCIYASNQAAWLATYGNDVTGIRVYRINADGEDSAEYQRVSSLRSSPAGAAVSEIPVASITGADDVWYDCNGSETGVTADLGAVLATEGWDAPPTAMKGACMFSNGMYAGFIGNILYLAMPGYYYAFPATGTMDYTMELAYDVVAMAAFNESLVVGTAGYPEVISGTDAAFMSRTPLPFQQPCLAAKGMVSLPDGVAYPSPDGLFFISSAGGAVLTASLMDRDTWNAFPLSKMICVYHNQRIFMFFEGYTYGLIYDRGLDYLVDIDLNTVTVYDVFVDPIADIMYLATSSGVQAWEGSATALTAEWKSGILETAPVNLAAGRVEGVFPTGHSTLLYYYVDGVLKHTQTVTTDAPFRLPSGFRGRDHELKIIYSKSTINALYLSQDIGGLANV